MFFSSYYQFALGILGIELDFPHLLVPGLPSDLSFHVIYKKNAT